MHARPFLSHCRQKTSCTRHAYHCSVGTRVDRVVGRQIFRKSRCVLRRNPRWTFCCCWMTLGASSTRASQRAGARTSTVDPVLSFFTATLEAGQGWLVCPRKWCALSYFGIEMMGFMLSAHTALGVGPVVASSSSQRSGFSLRWALAS